MNAPQIGDRVRCLAPPRWAPADYRSMVGQIGIVINVFPADPDSPEDYGAIGIRYPVSPYSDGTIAQGIELEGITWERA